MYTAPTLFDLCVETITAALAHGNEYEQEILEIPPVLFDGLMRNLPPLALQNVHELLERSVDDDCGTGFKNSDVDCGRKRGRYEDINTTWKMLYMNRWPETPKKSHSIDYVTKQDGSAKFKLMNQSVDWQQLYWEKHLQNCLDEAAETALLPSFHGYIGDLTVSDSIMDAIGHKGGTTCTCMKLSFHCDRFGQYMRCLKLQNVLCVAETCELLGGAKLQSLVLRRIISKTQVDGACMHLYQHRQTLCSLELVNCQIPPATIDQIFDSILRDISKTYGIQELYVKSSRIFDSSVSSVPAGLLSFLSFGRVLQSLCICDSKLQPEPAKLIIDVLLRSSSALVTLEISENNLSGWLSKLDRKPLCFLSAAESKMSLKSLMELSLRGNNLHMEDAEDLQHILVHMPMLRSLDISDNAITDVGIRSLIPYFIWAVEKAYPLLDIKLNNCDLSSTGVVDLLRSLPTLKEPLNMLSVAENDLGSSLAVPLAKFLASSGVRKLNMEDVGLGALGFQQLENQIPKEMVLRHINISKNRGGIRAAYFISKVLVHAPNIAYIHAGSNIMPPESAELIHSALEESRGTLEILDLAGNTKLSLSEFTPRLLEFEHRGRPIVTIPLSSAPSMLYDDDP